VTNCVVTQGLWLCAARQLKLGNLLQHPRGFLTLCSLQASDPLRRRLIEKGLWIQSELSRDDPDGQSQHSNGVATCVESERSAGWAVPPSVTASAPRLSSVLATSATVAPAPAKAWANASPIPRDAPVISTRFPRSSIVGAYARKTHEV
jgi:hypothetical protein